MSTDYKKIMEEFGFEEEEINLVNSVDDSTSTTHRDTIAAITSIYSAKTNQKLVEKTKSLAIATWWLVGITIILNIVAAVLAK